MAFRCAPADAVGVGRLCLIRLFCDRELREIGALGDTTSSDLGVGFGVTAHGQAGEMAVKTDIIISTLAGRSAGVVTRAELLHAGLASSTVADRVRRGYLVAVWPGLYQLPELETDLTPFFRAVKAVPGSVLSHGTAAGVLGFPIDSTVDRGQWHVTAGLGCRTGLRCVVVHQTRRLEPDDVEQPHPGLPATSPARTVLDLSGTAMSDRRLRHLVESQILAGRPSLSELCTCLDRSAHNGVPGAARLRRLLSEQFGDQPVPGSKLEAELSRLLVRAGLCGFVGQYRPPWYEGRRGIVDFADPELLLIVEADGRRWHQVGQAIDEDRQRDRVAAAHGWQVLRVTWSDVVDRPAATAEQLSTAAATRSTLAAC